MNNYLEPKKIEEFLLNNLSSVQKPGRYIGREHNSIEKDWDKASLRVALIYPDLYEIGMSNQGLRLLYEIINAKPEFICQRSFAPWHDMESLLRSSSLPLYSLESKRLLSEFDVIAFTLQHELNYTNILTILDLAGLDIFSKDRADNHPLIIGGGPSTLNPEPVADFFDFFLIGEAEDIIIPLLESISAGRESGILREELLYSFKDQSSVYVPSLYNTELTEEGFVITAIDRKVKKHYVADLNSVAHSVKPTVSYIRTVHDRINLEIMRGCPNSCRFCQARVYYGPPRQREIGGLISSAKKNYENTGYEEICLSSLSSGVYSGIENLIDGLKSDFKDLNLFLSLPSLWVSKSLIDNLSKFVDTKRPSLTFAPEVGSLRMKDIVGKYVDEKILSEIASFAFDRGWKSIKLYYMLGLPGLKIDDLKETVEFIKGLLKLKTKRAINLKLSFAAFIPKPHTPFQWHPFASREEVLEQIGFIRDNLRNRRIKIDFRDYDYSLIEAIFSRGDRRLSSVIYEAWKTGARFDSWEGEFNSSLWYNAFSKKNIDIDSYLRPSWGELSSLPWDYVDAGIDKNDLWASFESVRAKF
ncbi:MAG: TIGR03960 family B12-binding radical SAM protein [Candidatus Kaelpia aquatica]|nr:TIGR03960 family B12-binding radical SAM protein [Candidatus Kaelpia aquatica]